MERKGPAAHERNDRVNHVERGGEVHADTPDKWSDDDKGRQERGLPKSPERELPLGKEVPGANHEGYAETDDADPSKD